VKFPALIFGLLLLFLACGVPSENSLDRCTDDGCAGNLDYVSLCTPGQTEPCCSDDPADPRPYCPETDLLSQE
jgi:hypothetical protein